MACELPNSDTDIRLRSGAYQHPSRVTSKEALKQLIDKQISWELRHCSCQQPNPDGLFATATQLSAVSIVEGYILHFFGPFQGASNDLNLLHASGFMDMRTPDEWTLGDGIYACEFHQHFLS